MEPGPAVAQSIVVKCGAERVDRDTVPIFLSTPEDIREGGVRVVAVASVLGISIDTRQAELS